VLTEVEEMTERGKRTTATRLKTKIVEMA